MTHYRKRIRDAVKDVLLAANTLAGPNVFTSRARPVLEILQRREAVLSIYTADETSARDPDGHLMRRTLTVSIEAAAGGGDDIDDTIDVLAAQVEAAINANPSLTGLLTDDMDLTATTSEVTARGNMQVGAFRMEWQCTYLTERIDELAGYPVQDLPDEVLIGQINPTPIGYVEPLDSAVRDGPRQPVFPGIDGDCSCAGSEP
jgi:hypothetical protein